MKLEKFSLTLFFFGCICGLFSLACDGLLRGSLGMKALAALQRSSKIIKSIGSTNIEPAAACVEGASLSNPTR